MLIKTIRKHEKEITMNIKEIEIPKTAGLAPMAGVGDRAFREICKEFGAAYLVGEMASSKGLLYQSTKTAELLYTSDLERPMAIQLFGDEPATMASAAVDALKYHPDILDINMGCPAPKIAGNGGGSALMKNPELAGKIVNAVSNAVNIPVTVKFRKGWDEETPNAAEFAKIMEENGASAVCVHGRTRKQMYAPPVDIDIIAKVKKAVSIPVMGNGDVDSVDSCVDMYHKTNCDLVMIGRGALGQPWVFREISHFFKTGERLSEPCLAEKMDVMLKHISLACQYKGEKIAMRESRRHAAWYCKGMRNAAEYRKLCGKLTVYEDAKNLASLILSQNAQ